MSLGVKEIRELLGRRQSYLKCGNQRISDALDAEYGTHGAFALEDIKRVKKEVKKALKQAPVNKPKVKVINSQQDELREQLLAMAKKLGVSLVADEDVEKNTALSILKKKKHINAFHNPDIADQAGMHILLGCNHVPFHNVQLHKGIIEMIKDNKRSIKGFHLLGDFLDLNPLSSHDKGKFTAIPGLTLDDEYDAGNDLLDEFDAALPKNVWKTYLYGNHEDRYNRWMSNMDNAKTPLVSPEDGLELWKRGYNVKTSWSQDYITLGNDFDIFHGIYFSVHNAKAHLDKLRRSCAYVHTHRIQNYREGEMAAFNIGACADFTSKAFNYATRPMKASWANGFAINMIDDKGVSHITQINVDKEGHFYFGNKKY